MIFTHVCPTAFGYSTILFQAEPFLVKRIFLPQPDPMAARRLIRWTDGLDDVPLVVEICKKIQAYFQGNPIQTPWQLLDLSGFTPLQLSVLKATAKVPHGELRSYGEIASVIGHPRAFRFVGATLSKNTFPVLIPCHRVVRADGSEGGFSGGTDLKKQMLMLEKQTRLKT